MVEDVLFTYMLLSCPLMEQLRARHRQSRNHPGGLAAPTRARVVLACRHSRTQQSGHVDSFMPKDVLPTDPGVPFLETA